MAKIRSSFKSQTFLYDFNTDGGAIGTIGMGIFIPAICILVSIQITPVVDLTSGGTTTVDIGLKNGSQIAFIDNQAMGFNQDIRDYNSATFGLRTILENGIPFGATVPANQAIIPQTSPDEIAITIRNFPLLSGQFVGTIFYLEI